MMGGQGMGGGGAAPGGPGAPGGPPASMESLLQVFIRFKYSFKVKLLLFRLANSWPSKCSKAILNWWSSSGGRWEVDRDHSLLQVETLLLSDL